MKIIDSKIEKYAVRHTRPLADPLPEIAAWTRENRDDAGMLTGALEGQLLHMLVALTGARRVLEIGCYMGYSAIAMASALPEDGELITCEIDDTNATLARAFMDRSPHGSRIRIRLGPALDTMSTLEGPFDLVFVDADKESYVDYFEAALPLMRTGGLLVADNVLWSGRVLKPKKKSDRALVEFNELVQADPRVENVMLTVRDGVTLARKVV